MWSATRRPFVHPVRAPNGLALTVDAPDDHPWHHGLWFAIKFVNGENFWEEYGEYGVLRHDGPPDVSARDGRVVVAGSLNWIRPDRETVIIDEQRVLEHRALSDDAYAIDFESVLVPHAAVVLDRTPFTTWGGYGGLTVRGKRTWTETNLLLADDDRIHQRVHGRAARWCDLSSADAGLAIFDHPTNPHAPTPWYASTRAETYGDSWANFVNAAFLWDGPMPLAPREPLRFRYRVAVHDGAWSRDRLDAAWADFAR